MNHYIAEAFAPTTMTSNNSSPLAIAMIDFLTMNSNSSFFPYIAFTRLTLYMNSKLNLLLLAYANSLLISASLSLLRNITQLGGFNSLLWLQLLWTARKQVQPHINKRLTSITAISSSLICYVIRSYHKAQHQPPFLFLTLSRRIWHSSFLTPRFYA
jgi:hypothetical protein